MYSVNTTERGKKGNGITTPNKKKAFASKHPRSKNIHNVNRRHSFKQHGHVTLWVLNRSSGILLLIPQTNSKVKYTFLYFLFFFILNIHWKTFINPPCLEPRRIEKTGHGGTTALAWCSKQVGKSRCDACATCLASLSQQLIFSPFDVTLYFAVIFLFFFAAPSLSQSSPGKKNWEKKKEKKKRENYE